MSANDRPGMVGSSDILAGQLLAQAISEYRAGNFIEAHRLCAVAVEKHEKNFTALHLLGVLDAQLKDAQGALRHLNRALEIDPNAADVIADKGRVLTELRLHEEALLCYQQAASINPRHVIALHNQGCTLLTLNRSAEALAVFDRLLAIAPNYPPALHNRAIALTDLHRYEEAIASSERALALNPNYAEALQSRGVAYEFMRRYDLAVGDFATAARLDPDLDYLRGGLVFSRMHCCDWVPLGQEKADLIAALRSGKRVATPFAFLSISDSPEEQLSCARLYAADKCPPVHPPLWRGEKYRHDRIRVAYVSADFREHAVAYLIAGLFERHDRSRFEITAVSIGPDDKSAMRNRIQAAAEYFVDAWRTHEKDIAALVRQREIDVVVDLNGYTEYNRIGIFSRRPAPIQVNYLGYPGTLGAECMDYIMADRILIPEDRSEFYLEKLAALPDSYQMNDDKRVISDRVFTRAELGLPETGFVFCCFNNSHKITPQMFDCWMRILKQVDSSVLWFLETNATIAGNLKKEAVARGVDARRLVFAKRMPLHDHLARHRLADLFLDTLPYNAHTTASDALWAGLPVITCMGQSFAGRVAASLLNAIPLPELITTTLEAYEALAVAVATRHDELEDIKGKLAHRRLTAPLFDTEKTARHIEAAYVAMVARHQAGLAPGHIDVPRTATMPP